MRVARARCPRGVVPRAALFALLFIASSPSPCWPQALPRALPDADGDGLDDKLEKVLNTRPHAEDTDMDGFQDVVELARRSDPRLAGSIPQGPGDRLRLGFWSRAAYTPGYVRSFTFVYLPDGYPAGGLKMEIVVALPNGSLLPLDDSYLTGVEAQTSVDFVPVAGSGTALVMIVGVNLAESLIRSQGSMGAAALVWHGADRPAQAADANKDAMDGLWIALEPNGPIYFRRPIETPSGGSGSSQSVYLPIEPGPPLPPGDPNKICKMSSVPVGFKNGVLVTRVEAADCDGGWDAYCNSTECPASVGDEFKSPDPFYLLGT